MCYWKPNYYHLFSIILSTHRSQHLYINMLTRNFHRHSSEIHQMTSVSNKLLTTKNFSSNSHTNKQMDTHQFIWRQNLKKNDQKCPTWSNLCVMSLIQISCNIIITPSKKLISMVNLCILTLWNIASPVFRYYNPSLPGNFRPFYKN